MKPPLWFDCTEWNKAILARALPARHHEPARHHKEVARHLRGASASPPAQITRSPLHRLERVSTGKSRTSTAKAWHGVCCVVCLLTSRRTAEEPEVTGTTDSRICFQLNQIIAAHLDP